MQVPLFLVTDLDGTALGGNDYPVCTKIPPPYAELLDYFAEIGGWIINSGREITDQYRIVKLSTLQSMPEFFIGGFGRQLARLTSNGVFSEKEYEAQAELNIQQYIDKYLREILHKFSEQFLF